jgi:hypothetical protein
MPVWAKNSLELVDRLPRSFATTRVNTGDEWKNIPLATNVVGKDIYISLPTVEPAGDNAKLSSGLILKFIQMNGFKIINCTASDDLQNNFWATVAGWVKTLQGAYLCLSSEKINYVENIPKDFETGWNFAFWYCWSNKTKIDESNNLIKVERVTSMIKTDKPWGSPTTVGILQRVSTLVREAAKKVTFSQLGDLKKTLKSEEFFLQTFCGHRPISGLYTEGEFKVVDSFYNHKQNRIRELYSKIPKDYNLLGPDGLNTYFKECSVKNAPEVQEIEDAKTKRIPDLITTTRKGKKVINQIAKGSTLSEKIASIGGGDSVRTIGKVLWSPLTRMTQAQFVKEAMDIAAFVRNTPGSSVGMTIENRILNLSGGEGAKLAATISANSAEISQAVSTYLDVIPDRQDNESWKSTFGGNNKKL